MVLKTIKDMLTYFFFPSALTRELEGELTERHGRRLAVTSGPALLATLARMLLATAGTTPFRGLFVLTPFGHRALGFGAGLCS